MHKQKKNRFYTEAGPVTHILSALFTLFVLTGFSFEKKGDLGLFFGEIYPLPLTIAGAVFLFLLMELLLTALYARMRRADGKAWAASEPDERHPAAWFRYFAVIFGCWLPYMILYFPGTLVPDGRKQVTEGLGLRPLTNMHPWFLSWVFGRIVSLGRMVSDNFGFFLLILVLGLAQAACYTEVCMKLRQWKSPSWFRRTVLLWFAVFPLWMCYAQTLIKDGLACGLTALFTVHYIDLCIREARGEYNDLRFFFRKLLVLTAVGIGCCLTRRNGIHMVLPMALLLVIMMKKGHRTICLLLAAGVCAGYLAHVTIGHRLQVEDGSVRVFYSVMFQQTARTMKEAPEDITRKEYRSINRVLRAKVLAERYDPNLSDPVKNTFRKKATPERLRRYLKTWLQMGKRHPRIYLEAFLNGCYGYFYPFSFIDANAPWYLDQEEAYSAKLPMDVHHLFPVSIRRIGTYYAKIWKTIPVVNLLLNPAFWTWVTLTLMGWLCKRRCWKGLIPFAGLTVLMAMYCVSPVNGCIRYYLPVYACAPVLIFWSLHIGCSGSEKSCPQHDGAGTDPA